MTLATIFLVTLGAFVLVIAGMAIGVMLGRREIKGSCGGLASPSDEDGAGSCSLCSNPDAACRDLGRRSVGGSATKTADTKGGEKLVSDECQHESSNDDCAKETIDACKIH